MVTAAHCRLYARNQGDRSNWRYRSYDQVSFQDTTKIASGYGRRPTATDSSGGGDVELYTTPLAEKGRIYKSYTNHIDLTGVTNGSLAGVDVCLFGTRSKLVCGTVVQTGKRYTTYDPVVGRNVYFRDMVVVGGQVGVDGDSGGPWHINSRAAGIHSAVVQGLTSDFGTTYTGSTFTPWHKLSLTTGKNIYIKY